MPKKIEADRLSRLVDVEATADWRWRKDEQFPQDQRNRKAAELLDRLAQEIPALNGGPLHLRLETFADEEMFSLEISGKLKAVGFRYYPRSGQELLQDIVADLERRYAPRPYLRIV
jgi:hypothetical protein